MDALDTDRRQKPARGLITRARADAVIAQLIEAADRVNADDVAMFWVQEVVVFGSYLGEKPTLGDLDIAIDIRGRWSSDADYEERRERLFAAHPIPRHTAETFMGRLTWPDTVLKRQMRVARGISLHDRSEIDLLGCPFRVIYRRDDACRLSGDYANSATAARETADRC